MRRISLSLLFFFSVHCLLAQWTTSGNNIYNSNTGNVGIGTTSPSLPFTLFTTNSADAMQIKNTNTQNGNAVIEYFTYDGSATYLGQVFGPWGGGLTSPSVYESNTSIFITPVLNAPLSGISLLTNGSVGIGTTGPTTRLDVVGSIVAEGANVNSNTTKMFVKNNGGKTWAMSAGENNVNETNFGIYDWSDNEAVPYFTITTQGNVLIGKTSQVNSSYMLDVAGNVRAGEIVVNTTGADFVFDSSYALPALRTVQDYINRYHHLPGIAPATKMQAEGVKVGDNQARLLQKVEELTLYAIDADKQAARQDSLIARQQALLLQLQAQLNVQQAEIYRLKEQRIPENCDSKTL